MSTNFWLADEYNVFVIGNHTQSNASATGQVWVGQKATYNNYNIGADLPVKRELNLWVLGNMDITGGINYSGSSGYDVLGSLTKYTMTNNNGITPQPKTFEYRPWDIYPYNFLLCTTVGWAGLSTGGIVNTTGKILTLTGTNTSLNNFVVDDSLINMSTITNVNIVAPLGSTIIVSIVGNNITLGNYTTFLNGVQITKAQSAYVLWNFPDATSLHINCDVYGSLLAPYATTTTSNVTLYGTLMTNNLTGKINCVNNPFLGTLPDLYNPSTTGSCSSFTTTTTTTTTSTTTTTTSSTESFTVVPPTPRIQSLTDLIESVALEQTALSHILNAEGEKIQKALSLNISPEQMLIINASVKNMTKAISSLELILQEKLSIAKSGLNK